MYRQALHRGEPLPLDHLTDLSRIFCCDARPRIFTARYNRLDVWAARGAIRNSPCTCRASWMSERLPGN
jgi:hypothetical protein